MRNTDDETGQFVGTNLDERSDVRVTRLRFVERELFTQQLRGTHRLDRVTSNWHYGYSLADRLEPNRRIYQYDRGINTNDPYTLSFKPEGNRRFFSDLDDTSHDLALSVRYDFGETQNKKEAPSFIQAGAALITRDRTVETRRFKFVGPIDVPQSLDDPFVRDNIGPS